MAWSGKGRFNGVPTTTRLIYTCVYFGLYCIFGIIDWFTNFNIAFEVQMLYILYVQIEVDGIKCRIRECPI